MEPVRDIMTPEQVAEYLQLDRETIYRYIRSGKLAASRFGRAYRIAKFDVDILMQRTKVPSDFVPRDYTREEMEQWFADDTIDDTTREAFTRAVAKL